MHHLDIDLDIISNVASLILSLSGVFFIFYKPIKSRMQATKEEHQELMKEVREEIVEDVNKVKDQAKQTSQEINALKEATQSLLRLEIHKICDRACVRGYTTHRERFQVDILAPGYFATGGNGMTQAEIEVFNQLEIRAEE